VLAYWAFEIYNYSLYLERRKSVRGAVLVTGTSSGIGKDAALSLHAAGLDVYAGVRNVVDGETLIKDARRFSTSLSKFQYVILDVTNENHVHEAYNKIASDVGARGLLGLVNNVGSAGWGPLEHLSIQELQKVMDVNFYGELRVLTTFAPLLRQADQIGQFPRVLWLGSIFGSMELPGMGPYLISKHALEAAAHTFARETFINTNIRSIIIAPALVKTLLWDKIEGLTNKMFSTLPIESQRRWAPVKSATDNLCAAGKHGISTSWVTALIDHAIFAPWPNRAYHTNPERPAFLLPYLPYGVQDMFARLMYGRVTNEVY
jgi:NAD(P)-dependent dehydrogenase (short-subunit alcohol dehydrogenase family)